MLYQPNRLSVCPSIHQRLFPDSNLSSFWPIFFKLCMDIDIREEWFGIANKAKFVDKQQSYGPWLM